VLLTLLYVQRDETRQFRRVGVGGANYLLDALCPHLIALRVNKSSAVAEMGDSDRAKWAEKWGAAVPLSV